jgi:hypothetical protein
VTPSRMLFWEVRCTEVQPRSKGIMGSAVF